MTVEEKKEILGFLNRAYVLLHIVVTNEQMEDIENDEYIYCPLGEVIDNVKNFDTE